MRVVANELDFGEVVVGERVTLVAELRNGGAAATPPCSKLEKLTRSVRGRLVEAFSPEKVDPMLAAVVECIETTWMSKE